MWSMILLMSRLPGSHSKSVGRRHRQRERESDTQTDKTVVGDSEMIVNIATQTDDHRQTETEADRCVSVSQLLMRR